MKRLVAFDLDGTLAESKQPLGEAMAEGLKQLLAVADAAIISGGDWLQFERQVADRLLPQTRRERLWLMPTTGTKLYRYQRGWHKIYSEDFDESEKAAIRNAFTTAPAAIGMPEEQTWGERLEDRSSQFTYSGLGQDAPPDAKAKWDPDRRKRTALQGELQRLLPNLSVRLGGTTSIDITRSGVDKAYALRRLTEQSGIAIEEMLFIGDALYSGGNDEPVRSTGVDAIQVRDPHETGAVVAAITACLRGQVAASGAGGSATLQTSP